MHQTCFNLVIENLLISTRCRCYRARRGMSGFNLVIENLLISTIESLILMFLDIHRFNLVIENLLISTSWSPISFTPTSLSFNLVIENLLISTLSENWAQRIYRRDNLFQSRNRESSYFNIHKGESIKCHELYGFNLVIENLLISTVRKPQSFVIPI